MKKGLVSIIVPVYKVEEYLERCIESIIKQTYKEIEIILVDDGSPDNCPIICDKWAKKDKRIKVIHKKNGGVSSARNAGLDNATGEFIGFVDSDDVISNHMYEYLVSGMTENIDFSCCKRTSKENFDDEISKSSIITAKQRLLNIYPWHGSVWDGLFKREIIQKYKIRFNQEYHFGEDLIFITEYLTKCTGKVTFFDNEMYYYYMNEKSVTRQNDEMIRMKNEYTYFNAIRFSLKIIEDSDLYCDEFIDKYTNYICCVYKGFKNINFSKELIQELKKYKKYLTLKRKIFFILVNIYPNLIYFLYKRKEQK